MSRFVAFVSGRRTKYFVLALWVVLVVALGPFAGRFEGAQRNEPSSFLPEGAESVKVLDASDDFPSGDVTPAVAVFRNAGRLTEADRRAIERARTRVDAAGIEGVEGVAPPVFSRDGTGAFFAVPITAGGDEKILIGGVEDVRNLVRRDLPAGVEVGVTGPAGFSADASKAFEGINTTLLFATVALVFVLLVLIYRSPIFWLLPLASVLFAESVVRGLGYLLAEAGLVINGQTGGILLVLVFGAGTDYALLLTARYREELRLIDDKHEAMAVALRQAGPAVIASAGTVIAALLCLSLAEVNSVSGLGPVGAMGVAVAAAAMLTVLPVFLLIGGRRAFWPFVPRLGEDADMRGGAWGRLGSAIERRHRPVWIASAAGLAVLALGLLTLNNDLTTANFFRGTVEAVKGQRLLAQSFPAGASAPTVVLVRDESRTGAALDAARTAPGVAAVGRVERSEAGARFDVTLVEDPYSKEAFAAIDPLRDRLQAAAGSGVLVGGPTAEEADLRSATSRDTRLLVPLVLAVVLAILILLLRSLVAPLMLMGTVLLSFFAALGGSLLLFELFADFPGEDPSYLLIAFIFLVALGVDYNIFLMARVREEAARQPTRDAMLKGLAVTGGVITSAGIVLAGTFSVLAVLPLVALTQIGITVALGVLLDTFVVRSVLVPALTWELGERTWWPLSLAGRRKQHAQAEAASA
ncbi:MAG TPA: MMPL family transporter [Gaiellaceae bacterium]|nr:MMPL family transporter [Gaiellaceae bacterium]